MPVTTSSIRRGVKCQLCRESTWDGVPVPMAVTRLANARVCAKHLQLVRDIAQDAGIPQQDLP